MTTLAIDPRVAPAPLRRGDAPSPPGLSGGGDRAFLDALRSAGQKERVDEARGAAAGLVSTAFLMPALESMREGAFRGDRFQPGDAERRFMPMLDREIADRIARAPGFPLVDAVAARLLRREGAPLP